MNNQRKRKVFPYVVRRHCVEQIGLGLMLKKFVAAFALFSVGWLLILPFLINWDDYQLQISKRIENVTGHKPDLTRGINVQFFPIPKVEVNDVVIKGLGEPNAPAFVEIGSLEARPSFVSLLAGKLQVDRITLKNPIIRLIRNQRGEWNFLSAQNWQQRGSSGDIFHKVDVVNGRVLYADQLTGHVEVVDSMNGTLSLSGLMGPFSLDASFKKERQLLSIQADIDKLVGNDKADVSFKVSGKTFASNLKGMVEFKDRNWLFKGTGELKGDDLTTYFSAFKKSVAGNSPSLGADAAKSKPKISSFFSKKQAPKPVEAEKMEPIPFNVAADIAASHNSVDFTNVVIHSDAMNGKGSFKADWKRLINTETDLQFDNLDLDQLLGDTIDYKRWLKGLMVSLPRELKGLIDISIKEVTLHKDKVTDLGFQADIVNGEIGVFPLTFTLPGNNNVSITGMISRNEVRPEFAGSAEVKGKSFTEFLDFMGIMPEWLPENVYKDFDARTDIRFIPHYLKLSNMAVNVGGGTIAGVVSIKHGNRINVLTDLEFQKFNLDNVALQARAASWIKSVGEQMVFEAEPAYVKELQHFPVNNDNHIVIRDAVWNGENVKQLETDIALSPGMIRVGQFDLLSDKTDIGFEGHLNTIGVNHQFNFTMEGKKFDWSSFYMQTPETPEEILHKKAFLPYTERWSSKQLMMGGLAKLAGQAKFKVDEVDIDAAKITNFESELAFSNGLQVKSFKGDTNNGKFSAVTYVQWMNRPMYLSGVLVLQAMDTSPLFGWLFYYPQLKGSLTMSSAYKSQGASVYDVIANLTGNLVFAFRNGAVDGLALTDIVQTLPTIGTLKDLESLKQKVMNSGSTTINAIDGKAAISQGVIEFKDLKINMLPYLSGVAACVFDVRQWMVNILSQYSFITDDQKLLKIIVKSKGLINALQTQLVASDIDAYIKEKRTQQFLKEEAPAESQQQPIQPVPNLVVPGLKAPAIPLPNSGNGVPPAVLPKR
ncbi:MAG: AsmA family protein [Alphaproteobacteria bacterium]|nr:AsmA family protein [Alphaproteobacteria bacterium]